VQPPPRSLGQTAFFSQQGPTSARGQVKALTGGRTETQRVDILRCIERVWREVGQLRITLIRADAAKARRAILTAGGGTSHR
jgi:hypothetical protein